MNFMNFHDNAFCALKIANVFSEGRGDCLAIAFHACYGDCLANAFRARHGDRLVTAFCEGRFFSSIYIRPPFFYKQLFLRFAIIFANNLCQLRLQNYDNLS